MARHELACLKTGLKKPGACNRRGSLSVLNLDQCPELDSIERACARIIRRAVRLCSLRAVSASTTLRR